MVDWAVIIGFSSILLLFVTGVPIFVAIGIGSIIILELSNSPLLLQNLSLSSFEGMNNFTFLAMPLYILTGDLISRLGLVTPLLDLAKSVMCFIRGGVSAAVLTACGFFGAISGSVASDVAVFGRLTIPELQKFGYPRQYSAALVAAGGCTAALIPPSSGYILLGFVAQISVADLFLATIMPGILVLAVMMIINLIVVRLAGYEAEGSGQIFSVKEILRNVWRARLGLAMPVVILGGIYAGVFTPTEAGAVAVGLAILYGAISRKLTIAGFITTLKSSGIIVGVIMPIVVMSAFFGQTLTYFEVQKTIAVVLLSVFEDPLYVMLIMFAILFVMGTFIDIVPNILILAPLLLPVAVGIGMDPVHFGVWFLFTASIGYITPPYGISLFVVSGVSGVPVVEVAKRIFPFIIAMLITNAIVAYYPGLSLWILG